MISLIRNIWHFYIKFVQKIIIIINFFYFPCQISYNKTKKDYDAQDLKDFEETILRGVGYDKDGKISRKELTMILLALAKHPADDEQ